MGFKWGTKGKMNKRWHETREKQTERMHDKHEHGFVASTCTATHTMYKMCGTQVTAGNQLSVLSVLFNLNYIQTHKMLQPVNLFKKSTRGSCVQSNFLIKWVHKNSRNNFLSHDHHLLTFTITCCIYMTELNTTFFLLVTKPALISDVHYQAIF